MGLDERMRLARLAYGRALAGARSRPTPASWRRLLAASRNLKDARRERERERAAAAAGAVRPRPAPSPESPAALPGVRAERGPARVSRDAAPARCGSRWPELEAELERARALVAWSRRLVREARLLAASLDGSPPPDERLPVVPFPA